MKIEIQSKKGLRTCLSIVIDKKTIEKKLNERLIQLQTEVSLKGFRPGKVPPSLIKSQFGKAVYGEVVDKILKESSTEALKEKKIKAAGQPRIDLKTFGEGKDLNYVIEVDSLPEIKLGSLENFKVTNYMVTADAKIVDEKLKEIANQHKNFIDKKDSEKAEIGDQITFDYSAKVNENKFKGSEGKGVQIELGKDLFLKDFDKQLIGKKKNDIALTESHLPPNHPDKELANKKAKFECKILSVKKPGQTKIDDNLAKNLGAKSLIDLKKLIENQISSQYKQALDSITKKEILDQLEKSHSIDLPKNLVDHELSAMTQSLKKDEIEKNKIKNEKLAKSRIKLGLILNEFGEKNNLKVGQDEINNEIQKQIRGMPGQEKMVLEYYKKNPHAAQSLKGALYEEKIINLLKSKITMKTKNLSTNEAEKIINDLNKPKESLATKAKSKKISKK